MPKTTDVELVARTSSRGGKSAPGDDISGDGGLFKKVLKPGSGEAIPPGKVAIVHYTGRLLDGTEFDCSKKRGSPFSFNLGKREVILGWDKGVQTMTKGEVCLLICAPDYAYGGQGVGPIPPNSTLEFEVELIGWKDVGDGEFPYITILLVLVVGVYFFFFRK